MAANLIDGKLISTQIKDELKILCGGLTNRPAPVS